MSYSLKIFILCCLSLFPASFLFAQSDPRFFEQVQKLSDQAMHKRQGLVIWTSLENSQQRVFGNRAWLEEKFLPGSLFKLLIAQAAVENGIDFAYSCKGHESLGGKKRHCWTYKGHGALDLPRALALSCNLYFENFTLQLGLPKILAVMDSYPSLRASVQDLKKTPPSDLALFGVGDDESFKIKPPDISVFWNSFVQLIQLQKYAGIFQGLKRSVAMGTASKLKASPLEILAKTGTGDALNPNYATNGWFLGAYPAKSPRYSLLILLQEAHGFNEPTGLAEKIFTKLSEFEVGERK